MFRAPRKAIAAMAMVVLATVSSVRAGVMEQVPGEALFVVKVTNLKSASDKIAKFTTDLGVAAFAPPLADPLGFLVEKANIKNGLKNDGDLAFAFLDPAAAGGNENESFVMLIPVSDYDAFIGNFADAKTADGISEFTPPDAPSSLFAAHWGEYAAVSHAKQVVTLKPSGLKVNGVSEKELGKDMVLFANMKTIRGKVQPHLAEGREEIAKNIDAELGKGDAQLAKLAPTIKVGVNRLIDIADSFLRDADASTIAINFVPEGLNVSVVAEFAQGSYLGNVASESANSTGSFTVGLPAGKYLFFGGVKGNPEHTAKLIDDVASPVLAELKKAGGKEAEAIDKMYSSLMSYVKATKGQTFGMLAPQGDVGQIALLQAVNIYTGDAPKMKEAYFGMMENQSELMAAFGLPADQVKYTVNKGAKTVEGVTFDQVKGEFKVDNNAPEMEQMMKFLYGPEGMNFFVAELGSDKFVQTFGVDDATIASAIKAAKAGTDEVGAMATVKTVNAQLPANKSVVVYVPIDEVVTTGLGVAKQFGFGVNVQMQPDLPPLAVSAGSEGTAIRIDAHAPTQLISQLIAAGFQIGMQMQGGGNGRKGGGPGGL